MQKVTLLARLPRVTARIRAYTFASACFFVIISLVSAAAADSQTLPSINEPIPASYYSAPCPHSSMWKPTAAQVRAILAKRVRDPQTFQGIFDPDYIDAPYRLAPLCNAILDGLHLERVILPAVRLDGASLVGTHLDNAWLDHSYMTNAKLYGTSLKGAHCENADLDGADLTGSDLTGANFMDATLQHAVLGLSPDKRMLGNAMALENNPEEQQKSDDADYLKMARVSFVRADLRYAVLDGSDLSGASLDNARLDDATLIDTKAIGSSFNGATLTRANLTRARLSKAILQKTIADHADFTDADLEEADLTDTLLLDATLAGANLAQSVFDPRQAPVLPNVTGLQGLDSVHINPTRPTAFAQLRKLIRDADLKPLDREATYTIERATTTEELASAPPPVKNLLNRFGFVDEYLMDEDTPTRLVGEQGIGILRIIGLDVTTSYGLAPLRALGLIVVLGALFMPFYYFTIMADEKVAKRLGSIYQVFPTEHFSHDPGGKRSDDVTAIRVSGRGWRAIGSASYFSLLSAVNIGFDQFTPGDWIRRLQTRDYTLEATGMVRSVAGVQALLSVLLLAVWALTQFGKMFD